MTDLNEMLVKPLVYTLPGMDQAQVKKDLTYHRIEDGQELKFDLYYPADFKYDQPLPAVIFVHGDGDPELLKNIKDSGQYKGWGQLAAASSQAGVTFNHRSSAGFTRISQVMEDINALIVTLQSRAAEFMLDTKRLALVVFSAGAPFGVSYFLNNPELFRCLTVYYGLFDLRPLQPYLPQTTSAEELAAFSPTALLEQITARIPPVLVVKAGLDRPDLNSLADQFIKLSQSQGQQVKLLNHSLGHHSFDILDNNAESRQIIMETLEFIQKYI
ncbi:MAG TPA: hypothetical protein VH186_36970 [Chloroflexia bacterium]|nr:hypothetical protein [Chloroflexia bacterium]